MKIREQKKPDFHNPFFRKGLQIGVLSVGILLVFTILIGNAADLRIALNQSTQKYLDDVTVQTARDIHDALTNKMTSLVTISDTASHLDEECTGEEQLVEFLHRKAQILEFDPLILLHRDGTIISSDGDSAPPWIASADFFQIDGVLASFEGEVKANYIGGQSIFYSVPISRKGQIDEVLIGVRSKENMQAMISTKNFDGEMLSCIINSNGQVVISPTDLKPFLQLDDIFRENKDKKVIDEIHRMQENMKSNQNGILKFTAVTKENLILSYNSLGVNDWFLLTLIPANFLSSGAERYILQSFVIIGLTILLFSLFLFSVYRFYHIHRKQLERLAFVDPLTGGPNNAAFQLKYTELAKTMAPDTYSILLVNVNGFKLINERLGIPTGNQILAYLYQVLERQLRPEDDEFAARVESDHFFLCLKEHEPERLQNRLDEMIREINAFRSTDLPACHMTFRQGACVVDDPSLEITLLQDRARLACQSQTAEHREKCAFYDNSLTERMKMEQELNDLFDSSIKNHDFKVYLQPKILLETNRAEGAEALVRWIHPEKGVIYPSDFIPLFEMNGKICSLDFYIFTQVCQTLHAWIASGKNPIPVSVNLSRQHFLEHNFLKKFADIAKEYEIPPGMIEFELTESIFFDNRQINVVKEMIRQMHQLGFLCSLDDFGSGFSSLGLLKEFDVDTIKLDRSFFVNMAGEKAKDVIACLIELSKKLKVHTVAEGIETDEMVEYLRMIKCDMVQGYIFSRPIPISEFEERYI